MTLVIILGNRGSGKTNLSTLFAKFSDVPVFSNYKINLENCHDLNLSEIAEMVNPCLTIMDEVYIFLESRTSGKETNRYLSYILYQSRKRELDFIVTAQDISTIDVRWRQQADFIISAYRMDNDFYYDIFEQGGIFICTIRIPFEYAEAEIFPLYNTLEKIETTKDISKEFTLLEPQNEEKAISELISKLESEMPLKFWSKDMIKDVIAAERWPMSYADKVFARAKRIIMREKLSGVLNEKFGESDE